MLIQRATRSFSLFLAMLMLLTFPISIKAERTQKPVLQDRHWNVITGNSYAPTAVAMVFQKGGNAVDAACAMITAT